MIEAKYSKKRFWPAVKIDKSTPIPLHFQIASAISQEVRQQYSLQRGIRFPSEYQLAKHLSVSRGTIHKAYKRLLADKVAVLKPGRRGLFTSQERAGNGRASAFPTLGLVLPLAFRTYIDQGLFSTLDYLSGILDNASELGFSTTLITLPAPTEKLSRLKQWLDQMRNKISGLIYLGGRRLQKDHALEMLLGATDLPQVFVSGMSEQPHVASVLADAKSGMLAAAEHLWQLGHEQATVLEIQCSLDPYYRYESHQRGSNWVAALIQCRLRSNLISVPERFESEDAMLKIMDRLTTARGRFPTALICHNDALAIRIMSHLQAMRRAVPADVSVVGYDDSIRVKEVSPPLTTIHQPRRLMGQEAVRLIFECREHGTPVAGKTIRLPTSLVVRGSTAAARKIGQ